MYLTMSNVGTETRYWISPVSPGESLSDTHWIQDSRVSAKERYPRISALPRKHGDFPVIKALWMRIPNPKVACSSHAGVILPTACNAIRYGIALEAWGTCVRACESLVDTHSLRSRRNPGGVADIRSLRPALSRAQHAHPHPFSPGPSPGHALRWGICRRLSFAPVATSPRAGSYPNTRRANGAELGGTV